MSWEDILKRKVSDNERNISVDSFDEYGGASYEGPTSAKKDKSTRSPELQKGANTYPQGMEKLARLFSKGKIDAERYEELRMELQDIFNVSKYDYASDSRETKKLRQEMEERGLDSMEQIDELTTQSIEQGKKRREARSAYDSKERRWDYLEIEYQENIGGKSQMTWQTILKRKAAVVQTVRKKQQEQSLHQLRV